MEQRPQTRSANGQLTRGWSRKKLPRLGGSRSKPVGAHCSSVSTRGPRFDDDDSRGWRRWPEIRWIRIASGAPTKKDARRHQDELDIGLSLSPPRRSATWMMTDQAGYAASPPLTCCIAQIAACVRFRTQIF